MINGATEKEDALWFAWLSDLECVDRRLQPCRSYWRWVEPRLGITRPRRRLMCIGIWFYLVLPRVGCSGDAGSGDPADNRWVGDDSGSFFGFTWLDRTANGRGRFVGLAAFQ